MTIKSTYYDYLSDDFIIDDDWLYSADDKALQAASLEDLAGAISDDGESE